MGEPRNREVGFPSAGLAYHDGMDSIATLGVLGYCPYCAERASLMLADWVLILAFVAWGCSLRPTAL